MKREEEGWIGRVADRAWGWDWEGPELRVWPGLEWVWLRVRSGLGAGPVGSWGLSGRSPPFPHHLQHLYVWLESEKAHERQRAVHSCMALLKFLSHNFYLDVSTISPARGPHPPSRPSPQAAKAHGVPAPRTGRIPESPVAWPGTPPPHTQGNSRSWGLGGPS